MTEGVFVLGTDTGVGKTVVAAGLTRTLRRNGVDARPHKPVESGGRSDARFLAEAAGTSPEEVCPYFLEEPLAPKVAAERAGLELDTDEMQPQEEGYVVLEGVGGLRVPLTPELSLAEFVEDAALPALVVARPSLGTLNHTALTVEALRRRDINVAGVVLNRYPKEPGVAERTNPDEIQRINDVPVRTVPEIDELSPTTVADAVEDSGVLSLLD